MTLDDAWIAAELAVCEGATPPPWHTDGYRFYYDDAKERYPDTTNFRNGTSWGEFKHDDGFHRGDEYFVVHARTGYPLALKALREALEALVEIKRDQGRVCPEFETCRHEACTSSYAAWAIADAALAKLAAPAATRTEQAANRKPSEAPERAEEAT